MEFDREEADDYHALREERENAFSSEPMPTRYSLRSLLMLVVPLAILSLMFRWMMESGFTKSILPALVFGAGMGSVLQFMAGLMSLALGRSDENRGYYWEWIKSCIYGGLVGSLGMMLLAFLDWWVTKD